MPMEKIFEKFLREKMKLFFQKRTEELARIKFKHFYVKKDSSLRDEEEQKNILKQFYKEIDEIVDLYIQKLNDCDLNTPEKIRDNSSEVDKITKKVEKELKKKMKK